MMPKGVDGVAIIIDYSQMSVMSSPPLSVSKQFLQILGDHYPERLYKVFFVDPSWYLKVFTQIIWPFVDPITMQKFHFVDGGGKKMSTDLWDHFDRDQVLDRFQGALECDWDMDVYWTALQTL